MKERQTQVLIIGGSLGGVAAALATLRLGQKVILTEENDWLGGQLTAQATPPDEYPWIEKLSPTASYRRLRDGIRDYYRRIYPLLPAARSNPLLNPGMATVSRLCCEPRVALTVLEEMLMPYRASPQLEILLHHRPVEVTTERDTIRAVTVRNTQSGDSLAIQANYVLDATELGDVVDLAQVESVIGAESQAQTGELHASPGDPQPLDQQAVTWCFALDYFPHEEHTIDKPEMYDFWRTYQETPWNGPLFGWTYWHPVIGEPRTMQMFDGPTERERAADWWHYRRVLYQKHYPEGMYPSDITIVNWPQNDYWHKPLMGVPQAERDQALYEAKQLSLSFLYWLQTEAPSF